MNATLRFMHIPRLDLDDKDKQEMKISIITLNYTFELNPVTLQIPVPYYDMDKSKIMSQHVINVCL